MLLHAKGGEALIIVFWVLQHWRVSLNSWISERFCHEHCIELYIVYMSIVILPRGQYNP
jgi:hypothetical protein